MMRGIVATQHRALSALRNAVSVNVMTQGANNSVAFTDSSHNALTVTTTGDIHVVTPATSLGSAAYFGGVGDHNHLDLAANSLLNDFGTGDFCIDGFIYCTDNSVERTIISCAVTWSSDVAYNLTIDATGSLRFFAGNGIPLQIISSNNVVLNNTLHWIEVSRISGVTRLFCDGNLVGSHTGSVNIYSNNATWIGAFTHYNNQTPWKGYIPQIRVTKGFGRNSANYTPPTQLQA